MVNIELIGGVQMKYGHILMQIRLPKDYIILKQEYYLAKIMLGHLKNKEQGHMIFILPGLTEKRLGLSLLDMLINDFKRSPFC